MALAHLYIDDEKYKIISFDFSMHQMTGIYNKPSSRVLGGQYNLVMEANKALMLQELMFQQRPQKRARIEVLSFDGMKMLFKVELANVYVTSIHRYYNHQDNHPVRFKCTLTPGITRYFGDNNIIHELGWNPDNPFLHENVKPTVLEQSPKFIGYFITDLQDNVIDDYKTGDRIKLNIETENTVGKTISFSLNDKKNDFKHNGKILQNDTLENHHVNNDLEQVELEVIDQQNQN